MDIITENFEVLEAPPAQKRWKNIWKHELELAVQDGQDLFPPGYNEIKRQRKRKKVTVKPKRKQKSRKRKR